MQGLRLVHSGSAEHIIVLCGAGSIGAGVIELLLGFGKPAGPWSNGETLDAGDGRARRSRCGFDLLTGDASRDDPHARPVQSRSRARSLIALTNVDTLNLEIALGAPRRPQSQHADRAAHRGRPASPRRSRASFRFSRTTYSAAALAGAKVFAGLSRACPAAARRGYHAGRAGIRDWRKYRLGLGSRTRQRRRDPDGGGADEGRRREPWCAISPNCRPRRPPARADPAGVHSTAPGCASLTARRRSR